jgi:hypothetical protein
MKSSNPHCSSTLCLASYHGPHFRYQATMNIIIIGPYIIAIKIYQGEKTVTTKLGVDPYQTPLT